MSGAIYADFTCPACLLASQRVDRMSGAGQPSPDWRAVEHRPRLPLTGLRLDPGAVAVRDRELSLIRKFAEAGEDLPPKAPGFLPHPAGANAAYAEAYCAGVADMVRQLLFRAYWFEARDISDPEVLRRLLPPAFARGRHISDPVHDFGYAVTPQRGPISTSAYRRLYEWQQDWLALGASVTFTLTDKDTTLTDTEALASLRVPTPTEAPAQVGTGSPTSVSTRA